jgi:hypothetical protein
LPRQDENKAWKIRRTCPAQDLYSAGRGGTRVPCMAKRPQLRAAWVASITVPFAASQLLAQPPHQVPLPARVRLQKPRLPASTSLPAHVSRLRMLQSVCMTPLFGQRRTMALHRLDSDSERGALLLLQGRKQRLFAGSPLRFTRGCLPGFANHWIIGEKLASFCAITIIGCDNPSPASMSVSARLGAGSTPVSVGITRSPRRRARARSAARQDPAPSQS